nr:uncharacterized protein LOC118681435 isoform X1 [Bactrocera oleae]
MQNIKFFFALLCLIGITAVIAQPRCQPRTFNVLAGQRICERLCLSGPGSTASTRCATARVATSVTLCPMNCCRLRSVCQWVYQA